MFHRLLKPLTAKLLRRFAWRQLLLRIPVVGWAIRLWKLAKGLLRLGRALRRLFALLGFLWRFSGLLLWPLRFLWWFISRA